MEPGRPSSKLAASALASAALFCALACGVTADFAGLQGGTRDGGVTLDGGPGDPDANPPRDAPGGAGFCASLSPAPRLCADFDEGLPVDTGWTRIDVSSKATVKTDSIGDSSSGSLLSAITPDDAPASARLHEALPLQTTQIHAAFAMLLPTGGGPFELFAIHETAPDGTDYGLFYKEEDGSLLVYLAALGADGGLSQKVYPLGAPPGQWLDVSIDLTLGDEGTLVVRHDGAVVIQETAVPTLTANATQLFVALGFYSPEGATARANFDDVVIDWP